MNRSPPMPVISGSVRPCTAHAATAASAPERGRDDGYEDQCADQAETTRDRNLSQYRPDASDGSTFRAGTGTRGPQRPLSDSVAAVGCSAC